MSRPEEAAQTEQQPRRGRLALQLAAAFAAGHACATNAYAFGWGVAANWQLMQTGSERNDGDLRLSDEQRAWLNSAMFLGTAFGCLLACRVSARFGPRRVMLCSLPPLALGHTMVGLAGRAAVLLAGRLLIGLASGLPFGVYVLYISGTASPRYRGALTNLADIICTLALIGSIALGEVLDWRWLAAVCGAVSVIPTGALLLLLPDDPAWLLSCGRTADAKRAAATFDFDLDLADTFSLSAGEAGSGWRKTLSLLTDRRNLKPLVIVLILLLFNAFSGYLAILSYSLEFFRQAGFQLDAAVCSILFCGIRVVAVLLNSTLVDRLGRRVPLLASTGGVALCYLGLVAFYELPALRPYSALPIVCILGAGFMYSSGLVSVPFCLVGEMFPLRMRQLGGTLVVFGYCTFTMLSMLVFPPTLGALGASGLFLTYAAIMVAACVFTLLVVPETKGLSLAAIETLFDGEAKAEAVDKSRHPAVAAAEGRVC